MFEALEMFLLCANEVMLGKSIPQGSPANVTKTNVVSKEKWAIRQIPKVNTGKSKSLNTDINNTSNWILNPDAGKTEKNIPIKNAERIGTIVEIYVTVFAIGNIKPNFIKYIASPNTSIKKGIVIMLLTRLFFE